MEMDVELLYKMAKSAADGAKRALDKQPSSNKNALLFEPYSVYPVYFQDYHRLRSLVVNKYGDEAESLLVVLENDTGTMNMSNVMGMFYRHNLESAANALNSMVAYLDSKLGDTGKQKMSLINLVEAKLRKSIYNKPDKEVEIQNSLETIFNVSNIDFEREKVSIAYSSKTYIPDFTFDSINLALEVKLCKTKTKEKAIVDEINADILAYQTKYKYAYFVIYDLESIRDENKFISDIENNPNVHVSIIKH